MRTGSADKTVVADVTAAETPPAGEIAYTYRPSLLGAPWQFTLTPAGIAWTAGRRSGLVPYEAVRRVRLSYRPANMQSYRFVTEIWAEGAPRLRVVSTSWKSMFLQERLDQGYAVFVTALHRRLSEVGAPIVYERGTHPLIYWPGVAVFGVVCLAFIVLAVRGLQQNVLAGAAFVAVFLAVFAWHGGNFLRRNRPGTYRPDAVPDVLLPKT
ncbi:hypothetical protein DW352_00675 [Pseudolabrys taiwanensis]|uniref:Uncharacterized protein n=1 Tax=Pseudolabrys taiwanensis TaxID=331696 RepID=A0A345ZQG1_9HYPH|nr:hypothetical protein [Pseudolabrys taiwanensis]AXK79158.1 hypothetical protein DW352_00675 [Pseudolabrys taiwanensis]